VGDVRRSIRRRLFFIWFNLRQALRRSGALDRVDAPARRPDVTGADADELIDIDLSPKLLRSGIVIVSLGLAWFAADGFFSQWDTYLRFRYGGTFGMSDPLFGVDIGFYVFRLPFYQLLQTSLMLLTVVTTLGVGGIYAYSKVLQFSRSSGTAPEGGAVSHLSVLLFILVAN
jgi:uncharacterized membrane protein (UPF0182 family)